MKRVFVGTIVLLVSACTSTQSTAEDQRIQQALATYLEQNFGMPGYETSWYGSILRVEIAGDTAIAHTNLAVAGEPASGICGAVSGYVFSNQNRALGISNVRVIGTQGPLIQRSGVRDSCQ
jgi:hypothetical protein